MAVTISNTGELDRWLQDLRNEASEAHQVEAGFLDSEQASIAAKNEYGGPTQTSQEFRDRLVGEEGVQYPKTWNVMPRPFMLYATDDSNKWVQTAFKSLQNVLELDNALQKVGEEMVKSIQGSITNGDWTPNNEWWSEAKGGLPPLIDSGTMLMSVDWELN